MYTTKMISKRIFVLLCVISQTPLHAQPFNKTSRDNSTLSPALQIALSSGSEALIESEMKQLLYDQPKALNNNSCSILANLVLLKKTTQDVVVNSISHIITTMPFERSNNKLSWICFVDGKLTLIHETKSGIGILIDSEKYTLDWSGLSFQWIQNQNNEECLSQYISFQFRSMSMLRVSIQNNTIDRINYYYYYLEVDQCDSKASNDAKPVGWYPFNDGRMYTILLKKDCAVLESFRYQNTQDPCVLFVISETSADNDSVSVDLSADEQKQAPGDSQTKKTKETMRRRFLTCVFASAFYFCYINFHPLT
jgi:hypothetical protein